MQKNKTLRKIIFTAFMLNLLAIAGFLPSIAEAAQLTLTKQQLEDGDRNGQIIVDGTTYRIYAPQYAMNIFHMLPMDTLTASDWETPNKFHFTYMVPGQREWFNPVTNQWEPDFYPYHQSPEFQTRELLGMEVINLIAEVVPATV